jgi:cyclin H
VIKAQITPLRKKLAKCRDPERWNLVELQRARREQAAKKAGSEDGDPDDRTLESDAAVFGEALPAQAAGPHKRRKVGAAGEGKGLGDPFGGPL